MGLWCPGLVDGHIMHQTGKNIFASAVLVEEVEPAIPLRVRLSAHVAIMRLDHSIKNIFVIPGIVVALNLARVQPIRLPVHNVVLGTIAVTLITCSN